MDLSKIFDKTIGRVNIIQFRSISVNFGSMYFFYFKAKMLELQKIFLIVRFFYWISCNKGLKAKISIFFACFFVFFLFLSPPWGRNVLESERLLCSWHHIGWRNTKICIHWSFRWERKRGKCWKLPIIEEKLWAFLSHLSEINTISIFYNFPLC